MLFGSQNWSLIFFFLVNFDFFYFFVFFENEQNQRRLNEQNQRRLNEQNQGFQKWRVKSRTCSKDLWKIKFFWDDAENAKNDANI